MWLIYLCLACSKGVFGVTHGTFLSEIDGVIIRLPTLRGVLFGVLAAAVDIFLIFKDFLRAACFEGLLFGVKSSVSSKDRIEMVSKSRQKRQIERDEIFQILKGRV